MVKDRNDNAYCDDHLMTVYEIIRRVHMLRDNDD